MARKGENITKRKDGRWEARLLHGHGANGRGLYLYFYGRSYQEAREKKYRAIEEMTAAKESVVVPVLFNVIVDRFIYYIHKDTRPSTLSHYRAMLDGHVRPFFDNLTANQIDRGLLERFVFEKETSGRLDGKGGLSPTSVRFLVGLIRRILSYGVSLGMVAPITFTFPFPKGNPKKPRILTGSDRGRLYREVRCSEDPAHLGVLLSLSTGMRIGELCALTWADVDFENQTILANKTLKRVALPEAAGNKKTQIIIGKPKTAAGERLIPLTKTLLAQLKKHFDRVQNRGAYLLTGSLRYTEPSNYYVTYQRLLRSFGIGHYSFHALRHTFATFCIEQGVDPKALSEILGHSSVTITLNRYVHPSLAVKRQQLEALEF